MAPWRNPENGVERFYRGIVRIADPVSGTETVQFVDWGNWQMLGADRIYDTTSELMRVPRQLVRCQLAGVSSRTEKGQFPQKYCYMLSSFSTKNIVIHMLSSFYIIWHDLQKSSKRFSNLSFLIWLILISDEITLYDCSINKNEVFLEFGRDFWLQKESDIFEELIFSEQEEHWVMSVQGICVDPESDEVVVLAGLKTPRGIDVTDEFNDRVARLFNVPQE